MGLFDRLRNSTKKEVPKTVRVVEKFIDIGYTLEGYKYFEYSFRNGNINSQTKRRADKMRIVVEKELDPNFFKCKVYFYKQGNKDDSLVNTMYLEIDINRMNDNNPQYVNAIFNNLLVELNEAFGYNLTGQESKKDESESLINSSIPNGHTK